MTVFNIKSLLNTMLDRGASDLHITVGCPPKLRIDGNVLDLGKNILTPQDTQNICMAVLTDEQKATFNEQKEIDVSFGVKDLSRFRANIYTQKGTLAAAFRSVPFTIPSLNELGLPKSVDALLALKRGLVLVTGPTGSGKSTSLASMINQINEQRYDHIVTIEDPIEFVHQHKNCLVNQREVHSDSHSFAKALKSVLRQDPDIVLVGELRDLESIEAALTVAETGHLVFATLHTNSAVGTINRMVDVFPAHQQQQIRTQLSFVLKAVISQTLLPKMNESGRVMACEVLLPTLGIRNLMRENKIHQIYSHMQMGQAKHDMQTLNQSLQKLCLKRIISQKVALEHSPDTEELQRILSENKRPLT